jgi:hypothetical protein
MRSSAGGTSARGGEVRRIVVQDRRHRLGGRVAPERPSSGEHLVQHDAEGEQIGARVDGLPAHLLGSHVANRTEDDAVAGDRGACFERARSIGGRRGTGQTEIENLDVPGGGQEHVLRLEIAVHDALVVRGGQPAGDLRSDVDGFAGGERARRDSLAQRLALQQLGDDVEPARGGTALDGHAGVEDREDVRVRQRGDDPGFLLEARDALLILDERVRQDLDGDVAIEPCVAGTIDLAHAAGPEPADDVVATQLRRDGQHPAAFYCASSAVTGSTCASANRDFC